MKKTLALTVTLGALLASSFQAMAGLSEPVLVVFGSNTANGTEYVTGRYLTEDKTWNKFSTTLNTGSTFSSIQDGSGNTLDGVSIQLSAPVSGENGRVTTINGDTSILDTYLDTSVASGVCNNDGGSSVTFSGLAAGTYTLQVLGGRGNNYAGAAVTTYSITGDGTAVTASRVLTYAVAEGIDAPLVNEDATITATTYNLSGTQQANNWALMEFTFTVGDSGTFTIDASGNSGNIAALMLVPEPATASLGLLGAFGLLLRRRRK